MVVKNLYVMRNSDENKLDERLEQLLLTADFRQLSQADQAYVYDRMDEAAFQDARRVLLASQALFDQNTVQPNPELRSQLMEEMRRRKTAASGRPLHRLEKAATYRIPLWQAVTAVAAAVLLLLVFRQPVEILVEGPPKIVYEYKTDTVFKEVPVQVAMEAPTPKIINRNPRRVVATDSAWTGVRPRRRVEESSTADVLGELLASNDSADFHQVINQYLPQRPAAGRPVAVDKDLMHFITEIH